MSQPCSILRQAIKLNRENQPNALAATEDFEFEALSQAVNYRLALRDEFRSFVRGDVLEVGAGVGQFTQVLATLPEVKRIVAVEPEPRFCEAFRRLYPDRPLVEGTIDAIGGSVDFDALVSINVLEHIAADQEELDKYWRCLTARHGYLSLFVPARPEIYSPIDRDFGHYRRYRMAELRDKLERSGFTVCRLDYFNSAGYLAWWLSFCVLRKRRFNRGAVTLYDRFIFPVVRIIEKRFLRPPLGQSLIAIGRA